MAGNPSLALYHAMTASKSHTHSTARGEPEAHVATHRKKRPGRARGHSRSRTHLAAIVGPDAHVAASGAPRAPR